MAPFRVALSGDFKKADGTPTFPDFDLTPLREAKNVEAVFLDNASPLKAEQLEDFDALILLAHRFDATSVPKSGRLAVVARQIIQTHYGRPPDHSYYIGCSTGGREAMLMSQRYPSYFDGIVAGAPAMRTGFRYAPRLHVELYGNRRGT